MAKSYYPALCAALSVGGTLLLASALAAQDAPPSPVVTVGDIQRIPDRTPAADLTPPVQPVGVAKRGRETGQRLPIPDKPNLLLQPPGAQTLPAPEGATLPYSRVAVSVPEEKAAAPSSVEGSQQRTRQEPLTQGVVPRTNGFGTEVPLVPREPNQVAPVSASDAGIPAVATASVSDRTTPLQVEQTRQVLPPASDAVAGPIRDPRAKPAAVTPVTNPAETRLPDATATDVGAIQSGRPSGAANPSALDSQSPRPPQSGTAAMLAPPPVVRPVSMVVPPVATSGAGADGDVPFGTVAAIPITGASAGAPAATRRFESAALLKEGQIDWNHVTKLGDLVPTERDALYRRAVVEVHDTVSARELIQQLAALSGIEFMMAKFDDHEITVNLRRNPFAALEQVVDNLGMGLVKRNNMWLISAMDKTTLVPHSYKFKHIHLDREVSFREADAEKNQSQMIQQPQPIGGGGMFGQQAGGYEKVTNRSSSLPPRAASDRSKNNFILTRIKDYLNAPPGLLNPLEKGALREKPIEAVTGPEPIYDADANVLFCVTTEQKWAWIEEFLNEIDQETFNVLVEVTFVTTGKNNHLSAGVNWAGGDRGGLGNGIAFRVSDPGTSSSNTNGGSQYGTPTAGSINLGPISGLTRPAAILSASELEARLRFYATEGNSRMSKTLPFLAENNREVVFKLTQNRPVAVATNTQNNTSGGAIVSAGLQVQNEDVGVVVRVIPQRVHNGTVRVNAQVDITNVTGTAILAQQEFPLIQTSSINTSPMMDAGFTAEIGGLEEIITKTTREKIPILGDIPILGIPFRDIVKGADTNTLNLLLRVRLLDSQGNEVAFGPNGEKQIIGRPLVPNIPAAMQEAAKPVALRK